MFFTGEYSIFCLFGVTEFCSIPIRTLIVTIKEKNNNKRARLQNKFFTIKSLELES